MNIPAKSFPITAAGLILSASVFFGGCAGPLDPSKQRLDTPETASTPSSRDDGRSEVIPSHLRRTIATNACESAGIQRIIALMQQSQFEVMLVYVPGRESPHECQWIEIGKGGYGGGVGEVTVKVDRKYLSRLMSEHTTLHLYHFHPLLYFKGCQSEMGCGNPSVPRSLERWSKEGVISNLRYSMPSPSDIAFMMDVSREFDTRHHGRGRVRNRVVTPYGIVDYSLTAEGKERLEEDGMEGERGRYGFDTYIKTRVSYVLSDIDALVREDPTDMRKAMKQLVRRLNNEYLRVLFTPFEDEKC